MSSVLVLGAGALGGLLAFRLTSSAANVAVLVGGSEHSKSVLDRKGVTLNAPSGTRFGAFDAYSSVDDVPEEFLATLKVLVVATKANDGKMSGLDVVADVLCYAPKDTPVVPLLNTVDAFEQISQALPDAVVLPGLAKVSAFVREPGVIEVAGRWELLRIEIGPRTKGVHDEIVQSTCNLLQCEGVKVVQVEDGVQALWAKCVLAAAAGVVAAACGVPCHEAGKHDRTNALSIQVAREMCAIAKAHGIVLKDTTQSVLKMFEPGMLWSIQRDVMAAKSSEVEAQLGTYVRRAEKLGVNAPTMNVLYALMLPRTKAADDGTNIVWPPDVTSVLPGILGKK